MTTHQEQHKQTCLAVLTVSRKRSHVPSCAAHIMRRHARNAHEIATACSTAHTTARWTAQSAEMSTSVKCSERILGLTGERRIGSLSVANSKRRGGVGGGTCCATSARCTPAAGGAAAGATTDGGTAATAARVRAWCKVGCTSATRDGPKAGDASWPGLYAIVAARVCMPGGSAAPLDWPRYWDICMSSDGSARRSGWEYM